MLPQTAKKQKVKSCHVIASEIKLKIITVKKLSMKINKLSM